jgi:Flagella basal body rod protein
MLPGKTCHRAASHCRFAANAGRPTNWHGRCIGGRDMETTAYIALSRHMALRRHMDVVANNVANMTASGFKAEALM